MFSSPGTAYHIASWEVCCASEQWRAATGCSGSWSCRVMDGHPEVAAVNHSMTPSARPSSVIGTVMPSALAVFGLTISSTLVACWTGRSPGFSPLYGALEVKHLFHAFSTSFFQFLCSTWNPVSSPRPNTCWRPTRTGAVKAGRRSTLAARSVVSRPRLDSPEHGGTLVVVGMTRPRGARCRGTRNSRRNLVSGGS